jgi:hypothetical protein
LDPQLKRVALEIKRSHRWCASAKTTRVEAAVRSVTE